MAHLNDLHEAQAKALLHKLCDAMGIDESNRTKADIEAAIKSIASRSVTDMDRQKASDTSDAMGSIHWLLNSAMNVALDNDVDEGVRDVCENAFGNFQSFVGGVRN